MIFNVNLFKFLKLYLNIYVVLRKISYDSNLISPIICTYWQDLDRCEVVEAPVTCCCRLDRCGAAAVLSGGGPTVSPRVEG